MRQWLALQICKALAFPREDPAPADLIFCFAGRKSRKLFSLELYARGWAENLILSTGRFELRRYSQLPGVPPLDLIAFAADVEPRLRHVFVLLDRRGVQAWLVPKLRFGTYAEIVGMRAWLAEHPETASVLVVSDAFHLRRIRYCWRALIPPRVHTRFVESPSPGPERLSLLFAECVKLVLYRFLCWAGAPRHGHRAQ